MTSLQVMKTIERFLLPVKRAQESLPKRTPVPMQGVSCHISHSDFLSKQEKGMH